MLVLSLVESLGPPSCTEEGEYKNSKTALYNCAHRASTCKHAKHVKNQPFITIADEKRHNTAC
jgi:hypothetical protein